MASRMFDRRSARARKALDQGHLDEAERLLLELTSEGSTAPQDWWNLGLVYKFQKRWEEALCAFRRNVELNAQPEGFWNSGVAATALRDWQTARWAWRGLGLDVGARDGPPEADFGPGPLRLNPDGSAEVVWGRRIDPCRMRIESVPLPESGHRWGDVVLHDVVPHGSRMLGDRKLSVFDELDRMDPSPHPTHRAELRWANPDDEHELAELLASRDLGGENWTSSIAMLCVTCSVSEAHVHEGKEPDEIQLTGTWGFGGPVEVVSDALATWAGANDARSVSGLESVEDMTAD
jgi:tetratricopeptide (TPR) repeat protein